MSKTAETPSAQTPDQTSGGTPTEATGQVTNPGPMLVDIVIHDDSTNDFYFKFDSGPDAFVPVKIFSGGETATNRNIPWDFWPSVKINLGENGAVQFLDYSLAAVNEELSSGKYHQVFVQLTDPGKVKVSCEQTWTQTTRQSAANGSSDQPSADQAKNDTADQSALVDVAVHNDTTTACSIAFDQDGPKLPPISLESFQSITNANIQWKFWSDAMLNFTENGSGRKHSADVSFTTANAQLSENKHQQVHIWIYGPQQVYAICQ